MLGDRVRLSDIVDVAFGAANEWVIVMTGVNRWNDQAQRTTVALVQAAWYRYRPSNTPDDNRDRIVRRSALWKVESRFNAAFCPCYFATPVSGHPRSRRFLGSDHSMASDSARPHYRRAVRSIVGVADCGPRFLGTAARHAGGRGILGRIQDG
jgi:hypothetical protein